ncbi:MAG: GNAT family N-acetyltransferase [Polyangiaceae bacterium]
MFVLRPAHSHELETAVAIDDDACRALADVDERLAFDLPDDHPFFVAEAERWRASFDRGLAVFACDAEGTPVGLMVYDVIDGRPYLEQVSVLRAWMRRGVGRALVERAIAWSEREGELWLTTYAEVPFNRPWYERLGFVVARDDECPPIVREALGDERASLPDADARVGMVYRHRSR